MTVAIAELVQVGVPFTWLGAVLRISFPETPLKFRAPGITVALGLGTGRLVFRALTVAEIVLAAVLTTAMIVGVAGIAEDAVTAALVGVWVLLAVQVGVLRPRLNGRTRMILAGETPPRSHLHRAYIALEGVKVVLLMILGVLLVSRLPA
jgi:hypothetical protein